MDSSRLPRIMLYGKICEGIRLHGKPKLRYKDQLKCSWKQAGLNQQSWEQLAHDRRAWRRKSRDNVKPFETARKQTDLERRKRRHEKLKQPRPPPSIQYTMWPLPTRSLSQAGPSQWHSPPLSTTDGKVLIADESSARTRAGADDDDQLINSLGDWFSLFVVLRP